MTESSRFANSDRLQALGNTDTLLYALAVLFWGFVTWQTIQQELPRALFGIIILGGAITIYTVENIREARDDDQTLRTTALVISFIGNAATTSYVVVNFHLLQTVRVGYATNLDYLVAAVFIAIILFLTYDAYGMAFAGMICAVLFYSQYGYLFPSWLYHGGLSIERGLQIGMLEIQGVYGSLTQVMGTMVAPFLLLAGLIRTFGGFGLIIRVAFWISKRVKTGIAQMAVISSLLIGSINGSALANTSITGSFTIPVLKSTGLKKEQAAAIESVSSSGGQIMPPVMGVAAFLMADILAKPLADIFIAAAIPAIIFYLTISFSVYQINRNTAGQRQLTKAEVMEELPEMREWLDRNHPYDDNRAYQALEILQFLIPIAVLFYELAYLRTTVMRAGMLSAGTMVLTGSIFIVISGLLDDSSPRAQVRSVLTKFGAGLRDGIESLAPLTVVVAAIGLMVDTLFTTGLPATLSYALIDISGGILVVLLVLTMILCIILGMGMPTSASYLIVALLVAPNLIDFGIPELPAHFFVLYFAILAAITPPIAPAIVIASGIAQADFWQSCWEAMKISLPVFVLPFAFVYNPQLISPEVTMKSLWTAAIVIVGMAVLSFGLNANEFTDKLQHGSQLPIASTAKLSVIVLGSLLIVFPK